MERKNSMNESQFNMSAQLAQRLYSKYSDTGQIIPNRSKNMKKFRARRNPKVKLPEISKVTTVTNQPKYPPMHFPKGFERFSGLDKMHLTQTITPSPLPTGKLPSLSKVPSQASLKDPLMNSKMMRTLAPSPMAGGPMLKHPLHLTKPSQQDDLGSTFGRPKAEAMKSLSMLKKEQDYANRALEDVNRRSVSQLKPIEKAPKTEEDEETQPIVFNREFGGSLSSKDLKGKMEDKDYLTPLDFIAC